MNLIRRTLNLFGFTFLGLQAATVAAKPQATVPKTPILLVVAPERDLLLRKGASDLVSINGFERQDIRRFFMLATGPEIADLRYNFGSSFFGDLGDNRLRIIDAPYTNLQTAEERSVNYKKQSETLWQCVRYVVQDTGPQGIKPAPNQKGCSVSRMDSETVTAHGGLCYFEIGLESNFRVSYELNKDCVQKKYLEDNQIDPGDFFVFSGYYTAGDASGSSLDLNPISQSRLHLSVEPWNRTLPLSADFGRDYPRWPSAIHQDLHIGALKVFNSSDGKQLLEVPLLANNRCPATCVNGSCASLCNFSGAIGGQSQIAQILPNGKLQTLDSWFSGNLVPAQWEGMLPAQHVVDFAMIKKGGRYRITTDLTYTEAYFRLFRDGFQSFKLQLEDFAGGMDQTGTIQSLPTLSPLNQVDGIPGAFPTLAQFPGYGRLLPTLTPLEALQKLLLIPDWPPYYESSCFAGTCSKAPSKDSQISLEVDFSVLESEPGQQAVLGNFVVRRKSKLGATYDRSVERLPDIDVLPDDLPF